MSVAEIENNGQITSYANIRCNNMNVDKSLSLGVVRSALAVNNVSRTVIQGELNGVTSTDPVTVYTLTPPPTGVNTCYLIRFIVLAKGGPPGNTIGAMCQITNTRVIYNNGVISAAGTFTSVPSFITFLFGNIGQLLTVSGNNLLFTVRNSVAANIVDWIWEIEITSTETTV